MRVSLANSDRSFSVGPEQSVLDAALAAGLAVPHGCKGGNCGACRARLLRGEISYPRGRPLGLSEREVEDGFVLLCQCRARSDLCIETVVVSTAGTATAKRLPARIERLEVACHDVRTVFLRLPVAETFEFEPGQYVDILLPGGRRRSFSIASPPHDSTLLELHVRLVPGGEFSPRLFTPGASGSLLNLEGPLGQFVYQPRAVPMLLVGGGTGLAPLKSILRHVIENALDRPMTLYWGVRSERDLYADAELKALASQTALFEYRPVLSEPDTGWSGRRGWVHDAVLRDHARLEGLDIYASGPPAMIGALRRQFPQHGADPQRLFCDSFDYALDAPARQPTMAANKS